MLFLAGILGTFVIYVEVYGAEEFNGNAGAGFAVLIYGLFVGFFLGVCGIALSILLHKRIP